MIDDTYLYYLIDITDSAEETELRVNMKWIGYAFNGFPSFFLLYYIVFAQ